MKEEKLVFNFEYSCETEQERLVRSFLENKLTNSLGGIYTNYKLEQGSKDVLSESEGLAMIYYAYTKNEEKFREHYDFVSNRMLLRNNLVSWRVGEDYKYSASASIDDLRIIRALIIGYSVFDNKDYINLAKKISTAVYRYECKKGFLVDYYDGYNKSNTITLSYIDLYTLNLMGNYDLRFKSIYENSRWILENGKIDGTPFFAYKYNFTSRRYSNDLKADMLQNAIVVEHLAEDNIFYLDFIEFIKNEMNTKGAIYSQYDIKTRKPTSTMESTAVYATLARIALYYKDIDLFNMLLRRMMAFQVKDKSSKIYGAFGDVRTNYAHSFDNLNALLALRVGGCYVKENTD
ncbi:hypothetical protein [Thermobrachium celere]|uniref:Uncharacterized protein n=1 Tax=Thermobrachium celere DSM 8682 TaxID=941824 RepID=R7RSN3_9CLOT|nr:hypothetical protein [Thermobrachium celere]CDF59207.1 hypothetical protein TCEL_02275 [Thermobrachium celere DSM 8682]